MYGFADEAGDLGKKFSDNPSIPGSTDYFVFVLVILHTIAEADQMTDAIRSFKQSSNLSRKQEIKFHDLHDDLKIKFFEIVNKYPIHVKAMIIDKRKLAEQGQLNSHRVVYMKELLEKYASCLHSISLRIDSGFSKKEEEEAKVSLLQINDDAPQTIEKIKFIDSKTDYLIQLADMIAGAIFYSTWSDKEDQYTYIELIEDKIDNIYYKPN